MPKITQFQTDLPPGRRRSIEQGKHNASIIREINDRGFDAALEFSQMSWTTQKLTLAMAMVRLAKKMKSIPAYQIVTRERFGQDSIRELQVLKLVVFMGSSKKVTAGFTWIPIASARVKS